MFWQYFVSNIIIKVVGSRCLDNTFVSNGIIKMGEVDV